MIALSLLRHGEVTGGKRFRGSTDDPLTQVGEQQMRAATCPPFSCHQVVSSPLTRCASFAKSFAEDRALSLHVEPDFSEMHFGDWEGCTTKQVFDKTPEALEKFWRAPDNYPPPNGERLLQFQNRVLRGLETALKKHRDHHTLIVTHGGVMRIILCFAHNIPLAKIMDLDVAYGQLFSFTRSPDGQLTQAGKN